MNLLGGMGGGGGMSSAASTSTTGGATYGSRGPDSNTLLIAGLIALALLVVFIARK